MNQEVKSLWLVRDLDKNDSFILDKLELSLDIELT